MTLGLGRLSNYLDSFLFVFLGFSMLALILCHLPSCPIHQLSFPMLLFSFSIFFYLVYHLLFSLFWFVNYLWYNFCISFTTNCVIFSVHKLASIFSVDFIVCHILFVSKAFVCHFSRFEYFVFVSPSGKFFIFSANPSLYRTTVDALFKSLRLYCGHCCLLDFLVVCSCRL